MKAQLSLEFLVTFLLIFIFISVASVSVLTTRAVIEKKSIETKEVIYAQNLLNFAETWYYSGIKTEFMISNKKIKIENNSIHFPFGDRIIEVKGVFIEETTEPV